MVAFNLQTPDGSCLLNRALFELNGGGGYVLKPKAATLVETAKFLVEAPKKNRVAYASRMLGVAARLGWQLREHSTGALRDASLPPPDGVEHATFAFTYDADAALRISHGLRRCSQLDVLFAGSLVYLLQMSQHPLIVISLREAFVCLALFVLAELASGWFATVAVRAAERYAWADAEYYKTFASKGAHRHGM